MKKLLLGATASPFGRIAHSPPDIDRGSTPRLGMKNPAHALANDAGTHGGADISDGAGNTGNQGIHGTGAD